MKVYIIIPAHNEAEFIGKTLESLINQTFLPSKIIVVDDNSTDKTPQIVEQYANKYEFISLVRSSSEIGEHAPGSKVIKAFNEGLKHVDDHYQVICKFDADLIFPEKYIESIILHFSQDPKVGMAGGFCIIKTNLGWECENLTSQDHIRGALKAYRKECFQQIGKLKPAMGWDTIDELLAQFNSWKIKTDKTLLVKHLKPTGGTYTKASKYTQGEAFYRLGYRFPITLIASAKLAYRKKNLTLFKNYLIGYFKAKKEKQPLLVTDQEASFIRALRWRKIRKKLF